MGKSGNGGKGGQGGGKHPGHAGGGTKAASQKAAVSKYAPAPATQAGKTAASPAIRAVVNEKVVIRTANPPAIPVSSSRSHPSRGHVSGDKIQVAVNIQGRITKG